MPKCLIHLCMYVCMYVCMLNDDFIEAYEQVNKLKQGLTRLIMLVKKTKVHDT